MNPFTLGLIVLALLLSGYIMWGRDWLREHFPRLEPVYAELDRWYVDLFNKSRTIFFGRMTAAVGYFLTFYDLVIPMLETVLASGIDLDGMVPGARWLGPALMILGHLNTYLRNNRKPMEGEDE